RPAALEQRTPLLRSAASAALACEVARDFAGSDGGHRMTTKRRPSTFDPYRILSRAERVAHVAAYQRFLHERDGEPDVETLQLAKREAFFRDIEAKPVRWSGDVDEAGFYLHMYEQAYPDIDPRTVMLVSAAKANRGESYGVDLELESFRTHSYRATENPLYL